MNGTVNLGRQAGFDVANPRGINHSGQVVGETFNEDPMFGQPFVASGVVHPFVTIDGRPTMIDRDNATAYAINNAGQVVGGNLNGNGHAFLYQDGKVTDLGTLGGLNGRALGINDLGQIVGASGISGDVTQHAFLYQNGMMRDLNDLIPAGTGHTLLGAQGIDDSGRIIAYANDGGTLHALLLTPVPEPTTLVGFGAIALLAHRVRCRRA